MDWQKVFLQFYWGFPQELGRVQAGPAAKLGYAADHLQFELWKAVGDELICTCEVRSEDDIYYAVRIWILTMQSYAEEYLGEVPVGTKGGAFIATFPSPDSASTIPRDPKSEGKSDADVIDQNRRALAAERDHDKYLYDYFGPGIDTGFRVLSRSSQRHFTVSVEVAYALSCAEVQPREGKSKLPSPDLVLMDLAELKGVWGGRQYPVFALDLEQETKVNQAIGKFRFPSVNMYDIHDLCQACYEEEQWPFRLYLPEAYNPAFTKMPPDPYEGWVAQSMLGSEELPEDPESGSDVRSDAPMS